MRLNVILRCYCTSDSCCALDCVFVVGLLILIIALSSVERIRLWILSVPSCLCVALVYADFLFFCYRFCAYFFLRVSLTDILLQRICEASVVVAVVWVPIVDVVVLVEIVVAVGVVIADDDDVVVVVEQDLPLLVGVFRLLELIWLKAAQMQVLGQLLVVSSVEVLAAA